MKLLYCDHNDSILYPYLQSITYEPTKMYVQTLHYSLNLHKKDHAIKNFD